MSILVGNLNSSHSYLITAVEAFFVSTETVHLQQQCCLMQMKIESSLEAPLNTKKQTTIVMLKAAMKKQ